MGQIWSRNQDQLEVDHWVYHIALRPEDGGKPCAEWPADHIEAHETLGFGIYAYLGFNMGKTQK